jgi:GT2 family glycosyltransferase
MTRAIVSIPAHNEALHIERCLAALAVQRDERGAPIGQGAFEILVLANNCTDATADNVRTFSPRVPHPVILVNETFASDKRNAGWARKRAMDLSAAMLEYGEEAADGVILTTDADSFANPTWFAANMRELAQGADCVAGYIDAEPRELLALGPTFLARSRLEDTYLRLVAELYALCDPRQHDPWPNHRVASGASLAVKLAAYRAVGGLPPRPLGEDVAFTEAVDRAGFKVRHSMEVSVQTSCRLDGRAQGGAADTMRHRYEFPDAECDEELEPALQTTRRAMYRGLLRSQLNDEPFRNRKKNWTFKADIDPVLSASASFHEAWQDLCARHPSLQRGAPLRPSELPRQIAIAKLILLHLRIGFRPNIARAGTFRPELFPASAI